MNLKKTQEIIPQPLRQVVLCFLVKEKEVLLAMKKRGFGVGRWNGTGGKPKENESLKQTVIRETQEEIGVTPLSFNKVAVLDFYFPEVPLDKNWNQQVVVYLVDAWEGEPSESEEMKPQWFKISEIPLKEMWSDDFLWLPKVLQGKLIKGEFVFDGSQKISDYQVEEVDRLR